MKTIIVPTDFSDQSMAAVQVAAEICRKDADHKLVLVHIYEKPISGITLQFEIDREALHEIKINIHKKFDEIIRQYLSGINVEKVFAADIGIKDILKLPELHAMDLIVMGTKGAKGLKGLILGSNAQQIVRNAHCPVIVTKDYTQFDLKNVVLASSFTEDDSFSFAKIKGVLQLFAPKYHLIKVFSKDLAEIDDSSLGDMGRFVETHGLTNHTIEIKKAASIEQGVRDHCDAVSADLVVIETHGRVGIDRIMQTSIAENLVDHLDIPVMTIKLE